MPQATQLMSLTWDTSHEKFPTVFPQVYQANCQ
jgi:hypothetical protein